MGHHGVKSFLWFALDGLGLHNFSMPPRDPKQSVETPRPSEEHTCSHCLHFQPENRERRPLAGNCAYHKEWIENASLYTCSDMSALPLDPKGIYRLKMDGKGRWAHVRRENKVRARLVLVKAKGRGSGREGG